MCCTAAAATASCASPGFASALACAQHTLPRCCSALVHAGWPAWGRGTCEAHIPGTSMCCVSGDRLQADCVSAVIGCGQTASQPHEAVAPCATHT